MTIWFLARATGLVALMAFSAATALGALSSRRVVGTGSAPPDARRLDRRLLMQLAHRSAAVLALAMLLAHASLIIADAYVDVSISATLLPFTAGYRPLALGLGTLAAYAFVVVAVSGAMRGRLANSARAVRRWRRVHLLAYVGWGLSMGHGVFAGTDTGSWWSTAIYATCGLAVAVALILRLRSDRAHRLTPLPAARTLAKSTS